jgi:hypothetical protein
LGRFLDRDIKKFKNAEGNLMLPRKFETANREGWQYVRTDELFFYSG